MQTIATTKLKGGVNKSQKPTLLRGTITNIERFLRDLQSDDPEKRFDVCERLLFSLGIPDKTIKALRKATNDKDPEVPAMARKALDVQLHDRRMNQRYEEMGS